MVFWKSHGFPCSCSELSYQVVSSSYFLTGKYLVFSEDQGAARKFSVAWGMLSYLKPNCYIYCKCAIKQTQQRLMVGRRWWASKYLLYKLSDFSVFFHNIVSEGKPCCKLICPQGFRQMIWEESGLSPTYLITLWEIKYWFGRSEL